MTTVAPWAWASATWRSILSMAASSMSGPTVTPSAAPLPGRSLATRAVSSATNGSATERCTKIRLGQMQACPAFRNLTSAAPLAAWTGSASAKTRNGA